MSNNFSYPAKILLFGEYLLINGGDALAIPQQQNSGKWSFEQPAKPRDLLRFKEYVQTLQLRKEVDERINTSLWESDLKRGLWFDSGIPEGYGAGSSGALVAAVYDKYGFDDKRIKKPEELKNIFATLEGYFHGNSSGFDPLVSYLNQKLLLKATGEIKPIQHKWNPNHPYQLFLIDTQKRRQTAPLVKKYLSNCEEHHFLDTIQSKVIPISNACITAYVYQKPFELFKQMKALSQYQLELFSAMIPIPYLDLWRTGLESADFTLKLCGAGGGGYILGIGTNDGIKRLSNQYQIQIL